MRAAWRWSSISTTRPTSDVVVLEAGALDHGPVAGLKVPFRLRNQVHGTWVGAEVLEEARAGAG